MFLGNSLFNSKKFLAHLELTNPVSQRYFYCKSEHRTGTVGTLYLTRLPFHLGPLSLSSPVTVCGIPMIYGSQTGFAPEENIAGAAKAFHDGECRGFQWIVGLRQRGGDIPGWSWKRFLTTVDLNIKWNDFGQYLASMRSDYRKQVAASLKKGKSAEFIQHAGNEFTDEDYKLFIAVHKAAKDYSEPLLKEFFTLFPDKHHYIKMKYGDLVLGWALLVPDGKGLYLLYIGYDVSKNHEFDTYVNLLLGAVRYAIENKYSNLKMGQTAELTKMRLGGTPSERYLLVRHSNRFVNWIISKTDIFNFRKYYPALHVFKTREK